jgi:integrase
MLNELKKDGKAYSTIKKAYDAVNSCFKLGIEKRTVSNNPAVGVIIPNRKLFPVQKIPFYTQEEAKRLIEQATICWPNGTRRYPLGSFVPLIINTGLRMGELLALKWDEDIDFENKTLTVHKNISLVKNRKEDPEKKYELLLQDSVKTDAGQDRSIPLNEQAINALLDLKSVTGNSPFVMTTKN